MSDDFLDDALNPISVALIGASEKPESLGTAVAKNLLESEFRGDIHFVNPKYDVLYDRVCFKDIEQLPSGVDLAAIVVPPHIVSGVVGDLAKKGVKSCVIITAGIPDQQVIKAIAAESGMRLFGPNCLGLLIPPLGLNASFAHLAPAPGGLAFLSQSGAILTTAIDWARPKSIGFSHLLSLGNDVDVDIATMLDHLAEEPATKAILIYMEAVKDGQAFMKAARKAAAKKPVIILKVGKYGKAAKAVMSHTGALAGSDEVYEAAFRKSGIMRADSLEELFDTGELLAREKRRFGDRLAIITNGGGLGIIAADSAELNGIALTTPSQQTITTLNASLPDNWSKSNPIDIIGDAPPARYAAALNAALDDNAFDAVLVLNCPTAVSSGVDIAKELVAVLDNRIEHKPVFTNWAGDETASLARDLFEQAGIPTFESAEDEIGAMSLVAKRTRRQERLGSDQISDVPFDDQDRAAISEILVAATSQSRRVLNEDEAKRVVDICGIKTVPTSIATNPHEVETHAAEILKDSRFDSCVIKIVSEDISHKSDAGGVILNLPGPAEAKIAAQQMLEKISSSHPKAHLEGFAVQPMVKLKHGRELILGIASDPTFGPVVMIGSGGTSVEVVNDKALDLPPLDKADAEAMIKRTRIFDVLKPYRNVPGIEFDALINAIIAMSRLAVAFPEIEELDINPLLADEHGVIALDARVGIRL